MGSILSKQKLVVKEEQGLGGKPESVRFHMPQDLNFANNWGLGNPIDLHVYVLVHQ